MNNNRKFYKFVNLFFYSFLIVGLFTLKLSAILPWPR